MTSRPVASPNACTMRWWLCPPSRPSSSVPSRSSNFVPHAINSAMRPGASRTTESTTSSWHSPPPAVSVSATWLSKRSSGSTTPAIPPCAHWLDELRRSSFVTTVTDKRESAAKAARKPANPPPRMSTSVKQCGTRFGPNAVRYLGPSNIRFILRPYPGCRP